MAYGIYIHIPFCVKRCYYCDFFSSIYNKKQIPRYIDALKKEISSRRYKGEEVCSIYIGGGTPSLLTDIQISGLINTIRDTHDVPSNCEITLEANPYNLDIKKLEGFLSSGINRLSLGVQSVNDDNLKIIGRLHDRLSSIKSIKDAHKVGFKNISVDLLYGLPKQGVGEWIETLETIINECPHHISTYELTIHNGTAMSHMIDEGQIHIPSDEVIQEMYLKGAELLETNGFKQYEISNFSLSGYMCKHNLNYWLRQRYIGIGAGAYSFDGNKRFSNVEDVDRYIYAINSGTTDMQCCTHINDTDMQQERVFLGLRMTDGIDLSLIKCGDEVLNMLLLQDLISIERNHIKLTRKGMLVSNEVILQVW